jgi:MYXO-CTERM domain-containing protein
MRTSSLARSGIVAAAAFLSSASVAQTVRPDTSSSGRAQTIDGFGTCLSGTEAQQTWWQDLYFDDLAASMLRMDLVPRFKAPYSDFTYNSPWFHNNPTLPGPENNNVRTYTNASDYKRQFAGRSAAIAVMGPDIDQNVAYFDYDDPGPKTAGLAAQIGNQKKGALGDFKLFASMWSPAPWLKLSSGHTISGQSGILPVNGTAWPFIWGGNFSGGVLDTSGTPRAEFDDSSVGGTGPTTAITQFARGLAAYLRGFQQKYGVSFYAISIQNELNFETFYNSCNYPLSAGYIAALKAARAELDRYDDLRPIRIMGPEDLLGGDGYGMWQYGGGTDVTHKNLQYLDNIGKDSAAAAAVDFFCIHGYAPNGVSSAGANPREWDWWANGWSTSPGAGLPSTAKGFVSYGKKSWMTETSGEDTTWLSPSSGYPGQGAFSIAVKIHQALTVGMESAWAYWQLTDGSPMKAETLTDGKARDASPKYIAVKHFFRYIRPGAVRAGATVTGAAELLASSYVHDTNGTLTVVIVNTSANDITATLDVPAVPSGIPSFQAFTSKSGNLWSSSTVSVSNGTASVTTPGYGVVTLYGQGQVVTTPPDAGTGTGGGSSGGTAGASGSSGGGAQGGAAQGGTAGSNNGGSGGVDGGTPNSGGGGASNGGTSGGGGTLGGGAVSGGAGTPSGGGRSGAANAGAPATSGSPGAAGTSTGTGGDASVTSSDEGGCGCRSVASTSNPSRYTALALAAALVLVTRRRRRLQN